MTSSRLRVVRISHSDVASGYRERLRVLCRMFPVDLRLIVPTEWPELAGNDADFGEPFEICRVPVFGAGNIPLFFFDLPKLAKYIADFQPDVVDVHEEPYSVSGFQCVWLASRLPRRPRIVFYSAQNIRKRYVPPFCWTEQFVYAMSDAAYPCSELVTAVLRAKGFTKPADVIPLGVDPTVFHPVEKVLVNESFLLGFVGRIEHPKGIAFLLEALGKLKPLVPNLRLMVMGEGSAEAELRRLADTLLISDRVEWAGRVPFEKLPERLASCDAVIVPSLTTKRWREQFGRVVVEAMACGVPVITSDSGSLPEIAGDAGLVVPERNSEALATAIKSLVDNRSLYEKFRHAGLARAQAYTWDTVARQMYNLYRSTDDKIR